MTTTMTGTFHSIRLRRAAVALALAVAAPARADTVSATFQSATDVPVRSNGYSAAGHTLDLTLAFAPSAGTRFTVVDNTGPAFIAGAFVNVAHGQVVGLDHGGITYKFVANYFGGTGNDLVLQAAYTMPMAWGRNGTGQLGNGGTTSNPRPDWVRADGVLAGKTVTSLATGGYHSLALCSDGTLAAWGYNFIGQLGDGGTNDRYVPAAVDQTGALAGKTVAAVAGGYYFSVALCSDGTVATWGSNPGGGSSSVPVMVDTTGVLAGKSVVAIAAGAGHCLALCSDGTLAAWGDNLYGQLGDGTNSPRNLPVAVDQSGVLSGKTVVSVAAGYYFNLALCSDGTIAAWGSNSSGQLGNGSTSSSTVPVAVDLTGPLAGRTVSKVLAGGNHSLALCSDGTLAAWGANSSGQLGDGTTANKSAAVAVDLTGALAAKTVANASCGLTHSTAICTDGTLAAWGSNSSGKLGDDTTTNRSTPVLVNRTRLPAGGNFSAAATSGVADHTLALVADRFAPRLEVETSAGTALAGGGTIDFGSSPPGVPVARSFTIRNRGTVPLDIAAVTTTGPAAADFTVTTPPAARVDEFTSTTFELTFRSNTPFSRPAVLHVSTSDPEVPEFTLNLTGTTTGTLTAAYATGSEVPLSVDFFTATGSTVSFSLAHAPAAGSRLTVVEIRGLDFIKGAFDNLAHGQVVSLDHGGTTYKFVANCFGGTGNDLVLQPVHTSLLAWGSNSWGKLGTGLSGDSKTPAAVSREGVLAGRTVIAAATGGSHSLALCADGLLAAWGSDSSGQLGIGGTEDGPLLPQAVIQSGALAGRQVVAVAAGSWHSLALCADGTVAAWGYNSYGSLGTGDTASRSEPVAVDTTGVLAGRRVVAVTAGTYHNLALCSDGTLAAWGHNSYGQLGTGGSLGDARVPALVDTTGVLAGKSVVAIAAGDAHSLALCSDGTLAAWGSNSGGRLGNGTTTDSNVPVAVDRTGVLAGKTVVAVAAGSSHSMALCSDGTVAAWGSNSDGRLGNGTTTSSSVPVAVDMAGALAGKSVVHIAAGGSHSLAFCADGSAVAWGYNYYGQLGDGGTTSSKVPVPVNPGALPAGGRFISCATSPGAIHNLAIVAEPFIPRITVDHPDGTPLASGSGVVDFGSTAPAAPVARTFTIRNPGIVPLDITNVTITGADAADFAVTTPPAARVDDRSSTSLTVTFQSTTPFSRGATLHIASSGPATPDFTVRLTGAVAGRLTAVYLTGAEVPLTVESFTPVGSTVDLSLHHAPPVGAQLKVIDNTGLGFIQGTLDNLDQGQVVELPFDGVSYRFVANYFGGTGNDLVLQWADTRVLAWGNNDYGQVGNDDNRDSPLPVAVAAGGVLAEKRVLALAAGGSHSLALCADGSLASWGYSNYGQLGNGFTTTAWQPVAVATSAVLVGRRVVAVAAGSSHSLALCSDGTVAAWGYNSNGQLGTGTSNHASVPVAVTAAPGSALAGKSVVAIAAGDDHSVALCSDGTVAAWGYNSNGELGNGGTSSSSMPVAVDTTGALAGKVVVAIAAGDAHNLALCSDGTMVAWGYNSYGQLGRGDTSTSRVPVAVDMAGALAGKSVARIAAGGSHSMALCSDGTLAAWGYNSYGQYGNGGTSESKVPVVVAPSAALAGRSVATLAAGNRHTMALCTDGSPLAWGWNSNGQLGTGGTSSSYSPANLTTVTLAPGERFVALASGPVADHSLGLAALPPPPQFTVEHPAGVELIDGEAAVGFTTTFQGASAGRNFLLNNHRGGPLVVTGVTFSGPAAADFHIFQLPAVVPAGSQAGLAVFFTPTGPGERPAVMTIHTNDPADGTFAVNLTGTGGGATNLAADWFTGAEVPLTSHGFTATGNSVELALHFAPAPGTSLTVVENTGLDFIDGAFDNLAHGQDVVLDHAGVSYAFVANYHGGTGNDLVLQWAGNRLFAWGANSSGQLGDRTRISRSSPTAVSMTGELAGRTVLTVATGGAHTLALCADGTLAAWGDNYYGQLGNGGTADSTTPVSVDTTGVLAGKRVVAVAAADDMGLALCADGTVAAWGNNYSGLGDGISTRSSVPVAVDDSGVLAGRKVVAIALGGSHCLLLCADGAVAAWGSNSYGQLGNGSTSESKVPVLVAADDPTSALFGKTAVALAAGSSHSMALCSDGTLAAWGYNYDGRLGSRGTSTSSVPLRVDAADPASALLGRTVVAIAAGYSHSLALCADGTLAAWGDNYYGQLGNGTTADAGIPTAVDATGVLAGRTVAAVAAGSFHSFALCADGGIAAWGSNSSGRLGNGGTSSSSVPVAVDTANIVPGGRFLSIAGSWYANHSVAFVAEPSAPRIVVEQPAGEVLADGSNSVDFGTAALGTVVERAFTVRNAGSLDLTGIAATIDGTDAGDFSLTMAPAATLAPGASTTLIVAFDPRKIAGRSASLHITSADPVTASFDVDLDGSATGLLAADFLTGDEVPLSSYHFTATGNTVQFSLAQALPTGSTLTVVRNTGRSLITGVFDNLAHGQAVVIDAAGVFHQFVANYFGGTGNDLVLQWAGTAPLSWGYNGSGQLGCNSTTRRLRPEPADASGVLAGKTVVATAAGAAHSLALCSDGTLAAWGDNSFGQLGDGGFSRSLVPVAVDLTGVLANRTVVAIAAGAYHSLALCADGGIVAWGRGLEGQLGNSGMSNMNRPVAVTTTTALAGQSVTAVACGSYHSLALCADGTVAAWGYNQSGQLGDGTTSQRNSPVVVDQADGSAFWQRDATAIAAGDSHSLALCSDGVLAAWGLNANGQLGDMTTDNRSRPVEVNRAAGQSVLDQKSVTALAAGGFHSLALCSDGTVAAWGANGYGQLGDATTADRSAAVAVNTTAGLSALHGRLATAVSGGRSHTVATCADGTVVSWGANQFGQLGNNGTSNTSVPVAADRGLLPAASRVVTVATGPAAWHNLGTFAKPPAALTPGEQWRLTWFGTPSNSGDAADDATPRNDGVTNLMKFATGMDPDKPATVATPLVRSGDDLILTYSRSKAAVADGVVFTVEWSDDLAEGSWRTDQVTESAGDQGATDLVTATLPAGPGPARFVRLRVHRR